MRVALTLAVGAILFGCSDEPPPLDPAFVDAVAELHLADARAETDSLSDDARRTLRTAALEAHGLDTLAFAARIRDLTEHEGALAALYDSVTLRLTQERQGTDRAVGVETPVESE